MRVSIVQNEIKWGVKNENLLSFDKLIKTVYGQTDLVVLPEMFSTGFAVENPQLSEDEDGKAHRQVKKWASEGGFAIVGSIMTRDEDKFFNRSFFCYPDGRMLTADKRHLFIGDEKRFLLVATKFLLPNTMASESEYLSVTICGFPCGIATQKTIRTIYSYTQPIGLKTVSTFGIFYSKPEQ